MREPVAIGIQRVGPVAASLLLPRASQLPASLLGALNQHPFTRGRIAGVYETTFYIASDDGRFLCIGGPEAGNGPITAIAAALPAEDWRRVGVAEGQPVSFAGARIFVADVVSLDLSHAAQWKPRPWPAPIDFEALACALTALHALITGRGTTRHPSPVLAAVEGRAAALRGDAVSRAIERRATLSIATLADWLDYHLGGSVELDDAGQDAVAGLIGLGPGLTPSGDDLIAGLLMALHATGRRETAAALGAFVRATAPDATSLLSRWLLEAAISGHPSEAMHVMLEALLEGDTSALPAALSRLECIGHTSGVDMLAGSLLGLAAVAGQQAV